MSWQAVIAIVIGAAFVSLVVRSMFSQWRSPEQAVPLKGKLSTAKEWLEENGYQVVRVKPRAEWIGYYDAREFRKTLTADFIVRKGPHSYLVKVVNARDTGISGTRLRDQWYPLYVAFQVDGILHVDLDQEQAHKVDFDLNAPRYTTTRKVVNRCLWLLSGILIGLIWSHMA
ncbi:MAG: hypothetical protein K6T63_13490 [Alicyclobacillus herbarius]|uniref:hypothetical protein n=1 Tax=Alicyclobacillus herbarius TaxID=122960 RepID=UPI0004103DA0|nr:hypothetical protein [Alicyclobacillus herbarius]MCL6633630.1 hypothetical protein [Alicyclobacillus herbarius]